MLARVGIRIADCPCSSFPIAGTIGLDVCLWLWAVNSGIPQALDVIAAWGFHYRSTTRWTAHETAG